MNPHPSSKFSSENMQRYFQDPAYREKMLRSSRSFFWRHRLGSLIAALLVVIAVIWYGVYIFDGLPSLEQLENPRPELATKIYSSDGEVLDQLFVKNRTRISVDSLPPGLVPALIATEDKAFYDHWGVHARRVVAAVIKNVLSFDLTREGASTITQQLSRNLYLKPDRHVFDKITRKFRELVTAIQIERNFTKKEILELYLNVSHFGRSAYGIESAAQMYFGKPASQLRPSEYSLLIGMLKGANYYDPIRHPERALARREIVIEQMRGDNLISPDEATALRSDTLDFRLPDPDLRTGIAPHFVESVRQQLVRKSSQYGFDILRDGLRVYTSINAKMQRHANRAVEEHLEDFQALFDSTWNWSIHEDILSENVEKMIREGEDYKKAKTREERDSIASALKSDPAFIDSVKKTVRTVEVGFVVINPHNGYVVAMVGGRNFRQFRYGLNHTTQIRRQPGSSFKPFVYTVALDNGFPVCYELLNQPVTIPMPDGTRWAPSNFERDFGGKYTLREALKQSKNLITVRAILEIAPAKQVVQYAQRMGITSPLKPYESLALGTEEVSPMEMATSFGVYANEGILVEPVSILSIEDKDGNVIEQNAPTKSEVLSKETAYLMTDLMQDAVNEGTGIRVRSYFRLPAAGKTGTTNDYGDAWFVGFTPHLSAAVWVGFDDNRIKFRSAEGQGGRAAAPIFGRFMQYTYDDPEIGFQLEQFRRPDGIVTDTICVETKKKALEFCPSKTTEIFNVKYPLAPCDKHTSPLWQERKDKPSKISW
jgi:penicillin-binding protein 1A